MDILKIDKAFVAAIGRGAGASIVAAVTPLVEALHLHTVAEGIETPEQATVVAGFGCHRGQGWLYGRPAPLADLAPVPRPPGAALDPVGAVAAADQA